MAKRRDFNQRQSDSTSSPPQTQAAAEERKKRPRDPDKPGWHPAVRFFVSLLLVLHMAAVFVAPWNLSTEAALPPGYGETDAQGNPIADPPPESSVWQRPVVVRWLAAHLRHYQNLTYINHGHEYCSPNPAGSHVLRYEVRQPDGSLEEGVLPNRKEQWPRLLYHRHLMLAEQAETLGPKMGLYYADHLAALHGAPVHLEWVFHKTISPDRVLDGTPLDAPSTYRVLGVVDGSVPVEPIEVPEPEEQP